MDFEDWFYEQEDFHIRAERFYDEMDMAWGDTSEAGIISIVKWLRTAYEVGKEHATMHTIDDDK